MKEWQSWIIIPAIFLIFYFLPVENSRFDGAIMESLYLVKWYAREHVLLCLVPVFFIAGAVSVFVNQASVMKYLGAGAKKILAYGVASISGSILAVCSCTVLPLFAGIWKRGAGLGPATAFLYSGPAINILAIILTARILGFELGAARAVGAIVFSIVIGLAMHFIFLKEERARAEAGMSIPVPETKRKLWQEAVFFASMVAFLVFANWGAGDVDSFWGVIYKFKWYISAGSLLITALAVFAWFSGEELKHWVIATWGFAKQIMPLLFAGVLVSGFLLGRPEHEGIIPSRWISLSLGGNSISTNLFASVVGAFMYFATLTEVPIVQGLMGSGMGKGPALALLLAGPALSLPNMLVIRRIMGTKKTVVYVSLVIVMATISGMLYGGF